MLVRAQDAAAYAMQQHTMDDRTLLDSGRILEAQNLYLSPGPHWTGTVLLRPSKFRNSNSHDVTTEWCHVFCNSLFTDNPLAERCLIRATDGIANKL